jgi:outer membrane protein assembly factor BamB
VFWKLACHSVTAKPKAKARLHQTVCAARKESGKERPSTPFIVLVLALPRLLCQKPFPQLTALRYRPRVKQPEVGATTGGKRRRRGNWALAVFGAFMLCAVLWTWFFTEAQRQDKWMRTAIFGLAIYVGVLLWVLLASKWRARMRWTVFIGTIAVVVFCRFCLRITGVTGDLLPIVDWRWKQRPALAAHEDVNAPATNPTNGALRTARLTTVALTNSYPQFLGPNRNAVLSGPSLARDWKQTPPRELWRHAVGAAWSGFAIEGQRVITQQQRGADELVLCYDLLTGKETWAHADQSRYATTIAGEGPRATPTISGNRVYSMGGAGELNCLDLATGKVLWQTNVLAAFAAKLPEWGMASSPLVIGRAVVVAAGGGGSSLVAYDKETGAVLWKGGNDDVHWSSPTHATLDGIPQVLIFSENVSSYDEQTGKGLWQYPWPSRFPHVTVPLVLSSNRVLVSQGYGGGSELLQLTRAGRRWRAERIWKSIRMKSKFANLIHIDGFVYGLDDGALACIDVNTGELKWKGDRYGHGQMILVGRLLLLMAESGDIVLLEPNPSEQRELSRFKVFSAKTWNPPALAGDLLLVRNDQEAACLQLPVTR